MGNTNQSTTSLLKQKEGLRIIRVRQNSPFDGLVEPFFDFIVAVEQSQQQQQRSTKQVLQKLTNQNPSFEQIITKNQGKKVLFQIVDTKYRKSKQIQVIPNNNWNGSKDLLGIEYRKERYDQSFDTYCPMMSIHLNSPIKKSGIQQGEYLIGCLEFKYQSINDLIQQLSDKYFDKEVQDKNIHFAVYNILQNTLKIHEITLHRGWGGEGLLGCDFIQGYTCKFPQNLTEYRQKLLQKHRIQINKQQIKKKLLKCDGVSKLLLESLGQQKIKYNRNIFKAKQPPQLPIEYLKNHNQNEKQQQKLEKLKYFYSKQQNHQNQRINILEDKVHHLEQAIIYLKDYITNLCGEVNQTQMTEL